MPITRTDILLKWSKEWVTLKAWDRDLSEVEIEISNRAFPTRLGTCWSFEQRLVVYLGTSMSEDLDTLLHELAHAATIGDAHEAAWQDIYATAIHEVTGIHIPHAADDYMILCAAGRDAMKTWWKSSGNAFAVKMLGFK